MPTVVVFLLLLLGTAAVCCFGFPTTMTLERAFPHGGEIGALSSRDRARHGRLLRERLLGQVSVLKNTSHAISSPAAPGVVDFPVEGSANPFTVGLYFTRVKLGNPAKEFYVQIDTGSDVLWVSCASCTGCPTTSGLQIQLEFFDPGSSSSAKVISCADQRCSYGLQTSDSTCSSSSKNSPCSYQFQYGDGSGTSGYYVSDSMHYDIVVADGVTSNSSADVLFGCSNSQTGDLTKTDRAVDGIFGFGQAELSIVSQLSSAGLAPKVFSHCLKGTDNGGGLLVLGEIVEPGIVYSPLVQGQPHYNLNLQSIAVNGQILPIASSVFTTTNTQGTIIDSGTTLAYLADQAYDPFVNAIISSVSQSVNPFVSKGNQCFVTSRNVNDVFPPITLNFDGKAAMVLRPQDYLLLQGSVNDASIWCIGWQKNQGQGITILGDLVLKDKIFIYDLAGQRIGWVNYDCSLPVNVSASSSGKSEFVNTGQYSINNNSAKNAFQSPVLFGIITLLLHTISSSLLHL